MQKTRQHTNNKQKLFNLDCAALWIVMLVVSLLPLMSLTGCARVIVLHPIEHSDITFVKEGEVFIAPKEGAFVSSYYIEKIMRVKVAR